MSAVKNYFREECKKSMALLEHPNRSDFYISAWQTTRSVVPLLILRVILFLAAQGILISSFTIYMLNGTLGYWFIYLTHWGLILILLTTGFGLVVSTRVYFQGPLSAEFSLPWYVKMYWLLFNITTPLSFLITIFYWTVLYEAGVEEELNHGLDIAVHGLNSLIMLVALLSSSHPSRLMHVYQPNLFSNIYIIFSLIYYFAGGVDPKGNAYIYPVVDWSRPNTTGLVIIITSLLLTFLHLVIVALAVGRDAISRRFFKRPEIPKVEEGIALRQPEQVNA